MLGASVTAIGDVDGDGHNEVAVGIPRDDNGTGVTTANYGAVEILSLNADGTIRTEQTISPGNGGLGSVLDPGDLFGSSVAGTGDLDGDGIPNTLDIDDDGDGFPDQVDQSSGAGTATPTAQYDTINGLNTSITWRQPAINYNYLAKMYADPAKLRTELSKLNSDAFTMSIRLVAPFVTQTSGVTIKDAWVDCTGLAWCVTDDSGSTEADLVITPRMLP